MMVVTGASGFIGANVVESLNRRGQTGVVAVDEYPTIRGRGLCDATAEMRYLERTPLEGCLDLQDLPDWLQRRGAAGYDDQADPRIYQPLNLYGESKQRFALWALSQANAPPRWAGVKYFTEKLRRSGFRGIFPSLEQGAAEYVQGELLPSLEPDSDARPRVGASPA